MGTFAWYAPALHKPRRFPPSPLTHDDPGNDRGDRSGRSPSRFVHVRSPRQAGLTAGNKSHVMTTRFGSLPVGGPPEVPGPEYRPGASHNVVLLFSARGGRSCGVRSAHLSPLRRTPPALSFTPSLQNAFIDQGAGAVVGPPPLRQAQGRSGRSFKDGTHAASRSGGLRPPSLGWLRRTNPPARHAP